MTMTTILFAASLGLSASEARPSLTLEDPVIGARRFEVPLRGDKNALQRAHIHAEGSRVVIFFPGIYAATSERAFKDGPVRRIKVNRARRGTPVVLRLRDAASASDRVRIDKGPPWLLQVDEVKPTAAATVTTTTSSLFARRAAQAPEPKQRPEAVAAGGTNGGNITAPLQAAMLDSSPAASRPIALTTLVGSILLAMAALLWVWRRQRQKAQTGNEDSIDIVAVRGFGAKHRLALIDTCGERFLLASSDKEVKVLGQINDKSKDSFTDALLKVEATEDEEEETASPEPMAVAGADLQGLLRLRRATAQNRYPSPLRAVPSSGFGDDGVAA